MKYILSEDEKKNYDKGLEAIDLINKITLYANAYADKHGCIRGKFPVFKYCDDCVISDMPKLTKHGCLAMRIMEFSKDESEEQV
ncbi:MAG: hypothetical protein V3V00_15840 [Saprospiraceae bacterium]